MENYAPISGRYRGQLEPMESGSINRFYAVEGFIRIGTKGLSSRKAEHLESEHSLEELGI